MEEQIKQMKSSIHNIKDTIKKFNCSIPVRTNANILPESLIRQNINQLSIIEHKDKSGSQCKNLQSNVQHKQNTINQSSPYCSIPDNLSHHNTLEIKTQTQTKLSFAQDNNHRQNSEDYKKIGLNSYKQSAFRKKDNYYDIRDKKFSVSTHKKDRNKSQKSEAKKKKTSMSSFTVKTTYLYQNNYSTQRSNPEYGVIYAPPVNQYYNTSMGHIVVTRFKEKHRKIKKEKGLSDINKKSDNLDLFKKTKTQIYSPYNEYYEDHVKTENKSNKFDKNISNTHNCSSLNCSAKKKQILKNKNKNKNSIGSLTKLEQSQKKFKTQNSSTKDQMPTINQSKSHTAFLEKISPDIKISPNQKQRKKQKKKKIVDHLGRQNKGDDDTDSEFSDFQLPQK